MEAGKYVVLDGMDGCGKGTQIALLKEKLGDRAVFTCEPGGTPYAEQIRKLVRDNPLTAETTALTQFLLFWAARDELVEKVVVPALNAGKYVFSDRGDSSTFAFQLYGEEHTDLYGAFAFLRQLVFGGSGRRTPDLYIVLDLPPHEARARALKDATREKTHFDVRDESYYTRVRMGFGGLKCRYSNVEFVDATQAPGKVHHDILCILAQRMIVPEFAFVV